MGQRPSAVTIGFFWIVAAVCIVAGGCDRPADSPRASTQPATQPKRITVASLVPAATDIIVGMGTREHLVAVSNWDADRFEIQGLPRVGDYRNIDWEKIAQVRPNVMIVQFRADKMPAGLSERAQELGIRLVNVRINHLFELFDTMRLLGDVMNEEKAASARAHLLRGQLNMVREVVKGKTPVRTLLTRSESSLASVGGGNYLDELLTLAGGKNVIEGGDNSYPTIDQERLLALNPDVVIQLLPGASAQVIAQSNEFWKRFSDVSAVKNGRVYTLTKPWVLLPGFSVGDVAVSFAKLLHLNGQTTKKTLTLPSPGVPGEGKSRPGAS